MSERIARFLGTARFLVYMTVFIIVWIGWNMLAPERCSSTRTPFTFLTLLLSLQASYAAPLILLAQNRQADRDRVSLEEDRATSQRRRPTPSTSPARSPRLRQALGEVATRDYLRDQLREMTEEVVDRTRSARAPPSRPRPSEAPGPERGGPRAAGRAQEAPAAREAERGGAATASASRSSAATRTPDATPRSRRLHPVGPRGRWERGVLYLSSAATRRDAVRAGAGQAADARPVDARRRRIGEVLVEEGLISADQLGQLLAPAGGDPAGAAAQAPRQPRHRERHGHRARGRRGARRGARPAARRPRPHDGRSPTP